jgi:hypothetical protein
MELLELVNEIKRKKELRGISDDFVYNLLTKELEKRRYLKEIIENARNIKELKRNELFLQFFKEIRKMLHEIYGVFAPKDVKRAYKILESELPLEQRIIELLKLSRPTKERLNFYPEIYDNLFESVPKNVLDLACGLNPISIYFSKLKPKEYYFLDVSPEILYINSEILSELGIEPIEFENDLFDPPKAIFDEYEYIFLWKTVPVLEKLEEGYAKELISKLNFEYLVLSFSRKSLSGRRSLGRAWRPWVYKLCRELGYSVKKEFETKNEMFFVVT